jgi:hypothetical protein
MVFATVAFLYLSNKWGKRRGIASMGSSRGKVRVAREGMVPPPWPGRVGKATGSES